MSNCKKTNTNLNDDFYIDIGTYIKISKDPSKSIFDPLSTCDLAIKLQKEQKKFDVGIGYSTRICQEILKDYIKEDYNDWLAPIFDQIKNYGKLVGINFQKFTKTNKSISLSHDYNSIKDMSSFDLSYVVLIRTYQYFQIITDISIVFEGESSYDFNYTLGDYGTLKMIINYNDLDGFFIKLGEYYKEKIAEKLGLPMSTDFDKLIVLAEMAII